VTVALRGSAAALVFAVAVAAAGLLRISAQRRAPALLDSELDIPPIPGDVARALAFGFRPILADLTLLEAIQVLPQRHQDMSPAISRQMDRRLARLLEYSVEVDPKFSGAYRFAGAALPHENMAGTKVYGVLDAMRILERGVRERPDDWNMGFLLGFMQSYYLHDFPAAARNFSLAARQKGAPAYLGLLATRLAAQSGELELATSLAEAMLSQVTEEATRKEWQERVDALHVERELLTIEEAARRYRQARGSWPPSVQALLATGYLSSLPREPHGGRYLIEPDGSARSTAAERLRAYGLTAKYEIH